MRSCVYECAVSHERFSPKPHRFRYAAFMFCLDLDEIDDVVKRIPFLSRNRFNLYSFHDRDHISGASGGLRDDLRTLLDQNGIPEPVGRVLVLTNLRILGYVFNPVSFFYCFDESDHPLAVVAEVNNTYGERKCYVLGPTSIDTEGMFSGRRKKHFYISPFIPLDSDLQLRVGMPGEALSLTIDDYIGDELILKAAMDGVRKPLSTARLGWLTVLYPLMTVKVIAAIHWEAVRLWLKGIPYIRKRDHPELQKPAWKNK